MTNQSLFNFAEKPQPLNTSADWTSWKRAMTDVLKVQGYSDLSKRQPRDILAKASRIEVAVYLCRLRKNYQPKGASEPALLYDNLLDNYKLEKCKNIADYAEQYFGARESIHSFDSLWDLSDALLIRIFMKGLGPSYKSCKSTFWLRNNLASTKNKHGSEIDVVTFHEVVNFAQKEEALQSQDEKNEVHAPSAHSGRPFSDHCPSEPTTQQPLPDASNQGRFLGHRQPTSEYGVG
ncbi:hypothetical protein E4U58_001058 [Claviceps cyperi]|nr:hypothetical protein E4U58_001058 [Claviceps cyperi]